MAHATAPLITSKEIACSKESSYISSVTFCVLCLLLFFPSYAHAGVQTSPLSDTICLVIGWFTDGLGRGIATLGIIVLGIGAMMGKVSWQMALIVAFGVSVMFSGATIVSLLTQRNEDVCALTNQLSAGYLEEMLCTVAAWANGDAGRALGTLAVIFLGITALMGKVSAGLAILLSAGIATTFNADAIVDILANSMDVAVAPCSPAPA